MKKIFTTALLMALSFNMAVMAADTEQKNIINLENGTTLKCTGSMVSGSITDYNDVTDYYEYQDGKLYSKNLLISFGDITKSAKTVKKLKITDDYITFKDRIYKLEGFYYKWVKINRKTGEYIFNAKNDFGYFFKRANVAGVCEVANK